jgi:hypothetical protein
MRWWDAQIGENLDKQKKVKAEKHPAPLIFLWNILISWLSL